VPSSASPQRGLSLFRRYLVKRALLLGGVAWLAAVIVSMGINEPRLTAVLLPLWRPVGSLAGPPLQIGTLDAPFTEATPVHLVAWLTGIALSALIYIGLAFLWLRWKGRDTGIE
jgi:hypothetical protein